MIVKIVRQILLIIGLILVLLIGIVYIMIPDAQEEEASLVCGNVSLPWSYNDSLLQVHPGRVAFEQNCTVCHAIRMTVVGPALMNVTDRRDSVWVVNMIKDGMELVNSGDSLAVRLYKEYNETIHPRYPELEDSTIKKMIEYIELSSEVEMNFEVLPVIND